MTRFLERYHEGEYEQVWAELLALGEAVQEEPHVSEAWAVARETMGRVRHNIELIIPRLKTVGYELGYAWAGYDDEVGRGAPPVFAPPQTNARVRLDELERLVGPLPVSLRAFYEAVGAVNFIGQPPDSWGLRQLLDVYKLDPLYVYPLEVAFEEYDDWKVLSEEEEASYAVPIAPDLYHKYGISGGMWYHIKPPNRAADAPLEAEPHHTTFVNYLRICFRWGGAPGLETLSRDSSRREVIQRDLRHLTEGLLPI
jgi:hypothetical protein